MVIAFSQACLSIVSMCQRGKENKKEKYNLSVTAIVFKMFDLFLFQFSFLASVFLNCI